MSNRAVDTITGGPFWMAKSFVLVVAAAGLFSCAPEIWFSRGLPLPPAYELKSQRPFADTALLQIPDDPGERSHGAKLTPRLLSSVLLFVATQLSLDPYVPATLGGMLYLLSGMVVGYRMTGDRISALGIGLLLAGLYSANACFSVNFVPKPFDGIALGMVALTMMLIDRPWLLAVSAYLACWTDERVLLSLGLILVGVIVIRDLSFAQKRARCLILAAAAAGYLVTRRILAQVMQWSPADTSMLGDQLFASVAYTQLAAWTCFEGGWITIALAVWAGWKNGSLLEVALIAAAVLGSVASCLIVLDISRAASFAFPLILAAFGLLARGAAVEQEAAKNRRDKSTRDSRPKAPTDTAHQVRWAAGLAAGVSLLATNFEIIAWTFPFPQPLPSTPMAIMSAWMNA